MSISFIFMRLAGLKVSSRQSLIEKISNVLDKRLEHIIDTHNTTSIIFIYREDTESRLLIKAGYGSDTSTHKEISWYKIVRQYTFKSNIEYVDSYRDDKYAILLLKYVEDSLTIDELALNTAVNPGLVTSSIQKAMDINQMLFNKTCINVSTDLVSSFYLAKYVKRRQEASMTPYLKELFSQPTVTINKRSCSTPDMVIEKIKSTPHLLNFLTPTQLGLIHGDLHCGNILTKNDDISLVDPNGNSMMPIEYDIGKILHSIHGNYGSIMRGNYTLSEDKPFSYSFTLQRPEVYEVALANLRMHMPHDEWARGLYAETLHFATMLPHHVDAKEETIALFLRCVLLFDELMALVSSPLFSPPRLPANSRALSTLYRKPHTKQ